ncbi:pyridoxal-phosphate dependent enzyme [Pseudonocardia xinjiangensis]|uniref:Pyridoxal-phosphate dependent enzyme n=1 Tax=Pseudonocardia xinjiangensis TaxID=75289 RepID=A0ABX1R7V8_9PSEU|nr:pyridoxal-phosphate dependent enzyme [Pseudonocardia xinjiangensis]NMH76471.1 pyridoxal-phosphate dependent enzyme [Pseudonocardia xinjiangensis]
MHRHYAEAIADPDLIQIEPGLVCLRFEIMKVRSALGAVRHLLDAGLVRRGDTLVDSSSGIYAHALALACHRHGMRCHIVGSTTVDRTLRVQLEILGATLEQVRPSADLKLDQNLRVQRVGELLLAHPDYHWMRQYHDGVHYVGYRSVADTVGQELPSGPLTVVGGVGTGASTGALATYLRQAGRDVELVGIQPFGSVTFGAEHTSDPDMIIAGIGSSIEFRNVRRDLYDRLHWMAFTYARAGAVALLRTSGVFAGLSAGAAYLVARHERHRAPDRTVVFLSPDTGHRYVDAAFEGHERVPAVDGLAPESVESVHDLVLPWSTTDVVPGSRGADARDARSQRAGTRS